MSDSQYGFATAVLTSKAPASAAALVDAALADTQGPVPAGMLEFFTAYAQSVQRHNQSLTNVLQQATAVFPGPSPEHGGLHKAWGALISALQQDIHANDVYFKNLKLDCVGPLRQLHDNDMGFSELVVNSRELGLVASNLSHSASADAEYQWNVKAPQAFDNLENYKRREKQLLFDTVLSFFNATNSRNSKTIAANEKAVNHLLGDFRIDREMEEYLQFLLQRKVAPASAHAGAPPPAQKKRLSSFPRHPDQTSLYSAGTASSGKKPSKLKSKVGSIFGRKNKKQTKANAFNDEAIAESASASSGSRLASRSTESLGRIVEQNKSSQWQHPEELASRNSGHTGAAGQSRLQPAHQPPSTSSLFGVQNQPLKGRTAIKSQPRSNHSPLGAQNLPNFVKYHDDASSSSSENGQQLSMLKKHDINSPVTPHGLHDEIEAPLSAPENTATSNFSLQPPQSLDLLDVARSRQSSGGKYSFEEGDDKSPVATSPRINRQEEVVPGAFEPLEASLPEPNFENPEGATQDISTPASTPIQAPGSVPIAAPVSSESSLSQPSVPSSESLSTSGSFAAGAAGGVLGTGAAVAMDRSYDKQVPPPPPPPSRKVHQPDTVPAMEKPRARRDVNSQIFHNLPGARESFAPPAQLASQDTGNSLLRKNDYFKHFESGSFVESSGLNASVAEVINVTFKDEAITTSQVVGEVAFVYNGVQPAEAPVAVTIPTEFSKVLENSTFVEKLDGQAYRIDTSKILSRTLGGLKYTISLMESQVPIIMQQVWKFEDHQASLMINLKLNPAYSSSARLDNFVVSVALSPLVQSTSASSRPQGSFSKERNRITWRYQAPLLLNATGPDEKLIARFLTNGRGSEHESGVQIRFSAIDPAVTLTTVYSADGQVLPSACHLVSGTYSSHL